MNPTQQLAHFVVITCCMCVLCCPYWTCLLMMDIRAKYQFSYKRVAWVFLLLIVRLWCLQEICTCNIYFTLQALLLDYNIDGHHASGDTMSITVMAVKFDHLLSFNCTTPWHSKQCQTICWDRPHRATYLMPAKKLTRKSSCRLYCRRQRSLSKYKYNLTGTMIG